MPCPTASLPHPGNGDFFPQKIRKVIKISQQGLKPDGKVMAISGVASLPEKVSKEVEGGVSGPSGIFCPGDLDTKGLRHCRHGTICCIF